MKGLKYLIIAFFTLFALVLATAPSMAQRGGHGGHGGIGHRGGVEDIVAVIMEDMVVIMADIGVITINTITATVITNPITGTMVITGRT